jgi:hypothetical protein
MACSRAVPAACCPCQTLQVMLLPANCRSARDARFHERNLQQQHVDTLAQQLGADASTVTVCGGGFIGTNQPGKGTELACALPLAPTAEPSSAVYCPLFLGRVASCASVSAGQVWSYCLEKLCRGRLARKARPVAFHDSLTAYRGSALLTDIKLHHL